MKKLYVLAISVFAAGLATAQVSLSSAAANQGNPELTSQSKVLIDKADNGGFGVAPKSKKAVTARGVNYKSFIRIGSTYYDLQTNFEYQCNLERAGYVYLPYNVGRALPVV